MGASITLCRAAPVSVLCKGVMTVLVLELLTKESEEETPSQVTVNLFKALEKYNWSTNTLLSDTFQKIKILWGLFF